MAIKSPKQKGSGGEREVIALLTEWAAEAGVDLTLERNLEQVRHGGADIVGVPGMEVEVKRVESNAINSWWAQVLAASKKTGKWPLLAHRRNRQPWRFRTYVYAAIYPPDGGQGATVPIVADLDLQNAKAWFKLWVMQHKETAE